MLRKLGLAWRMSLLSVAGCGLILAAVVTGSEIVSRRILARELAANADALAVAAAAEVDVLERGVERAAAELARLLESARLDEAQIVALLETLLDESPEVFGAAVALVADAVGGEATAPYVYRRDGGLESKNLANGAYRFEQWEWFSRPRELGTALWTEPYLDEGGGDVVMATYSVPLGAGAEGPFRGVVTCDVSLQELTEVVAALPLAGSGYGFIVSSAGVFITHPDHDLIVGRSLFSLAESRGDAALRDAAERMVRGERGRAEIAAVGDGDPSWLAYAPVGSSGWSLGVVVPGEVIAGKLNALRRVQLGLGFAGFVAILFVVLAVARSITRPLRRLDAATRELATGNLDAAVPVLGGGDEVARLASSFASMQEDLKTHIEELQRTTAAKERIERELQIAHGIQMSLVPKTFPAFPERDDFEVYAILDPAREVGGDFYDFFFLDDQRLCLAIGDVSGKGVPAALFMAVARTLLKTLFRDHEQPEVVLDRLNGELAEGNDSCMFVTLFCAVIDLGSGSCVYASGGHNPPYVVRRGGAVDTVPRVDGAMVGAMDGVVFAAGSLNLAGGDTLFMFTDGVVEALDHDNRLYGEERLIAELERSAGESCTAMVGRVRDSVLEFAAGTEQSDDITVLAICHRPETCGGDCSGA